MLENFKNLYEVRKVVRFELKPSKITQNFLKKQEIYNEPVNILYRNKVEKGFNYSKQIFNENIKDTLENIENIYNIVEKIFNLLSNLKTSQVYVERKIFEIIDKNNFRKYKKSLSGARSISFKEIKDNVSGDKIEIMHNYFEEILSEINFILKVIKSIGEKENSFSKNEIKRLVKKLSLVFIRIYNFLSFFDAENSNKDLSEKIKIILNQKDFFEEIKSYYFISENQASGILIRRFGFNEKSLKRRQLKFIKDELEKEKEEFEKNKNQKESLEKEKQKLIEKFELKIKEEKFPILLEQEKINFFRDKEEKTEEEIIFLKEVDESYKEIKILKKQDVEIKEKTELLNDIKKKYSNSRVKINNLEKELENNLSLTHYSRILTRNIDGEELYYLLLIPTSKKNILDKENLKIGDSKILKYNSLTFDSLKKLALSYDGTMGIYWDKEEEKYKKTGVHKRYVDLYMSLKENKNKRDFRKLKNYIKNIIQLYKDIFNIDFDFEKLDSKYNLDAYIKEFNKQGYKIYWEKIDFEILRNYEKEGKLELYQIYTKDFYKDSDFFDIEYSVAEQKIEREKRRKEKNVNGNKNLFSIYWENFIKDVEKGNYNVRLNSDGGFFVKLKDEKINEEGKSRKKRDKIIGSFNLLFNPNKTIGRKLDEKENIKEFNNFYKKQIIQNLKEDNVFIGLDRGEYELLTYCLIDKNNNCIKDENGEYLIGDFNCINSKGEFIKKDDCIWKDKNGKIYKDLIGDFLPTFSQGKENIINGKKSYKFDDKLNLYYFELNHNSKFYLLDGEKEKFKIKNKNNEEIFLEDKNGNKVINYYLIFKSEIYKRYILNDKETENRIKDIKLEDIQYLRGGYISMVIKQLNFWIEKYNGIICLENLDKIQSDKNNKQIDFTNKENIINKTFGVTIYQEIETLLNRKYNYVIFKDSGINFQLTPKIKNISDIKNLEKSSNDVNLGNLIFIDEYNTSKECPNCGKTLKRLKKGGDNVFHDKEYEGKEGCNFDTRIRGNNYGFNFIKSGDDLATYNIAKKAKEYLENLIKNK